MKILKEDKMGFTPLEIRNRRIITSVMNIGEVYPSSSIGKRKCRWRFLSLTGFTPLEISKTLSKKPKSLTGFTLIELFIAVSIFAVVAIALYSTFFAGISIWRRSSEGEDVYQDIRFVFDDITRDLKNVIYYTKEEESIFVFSGMNNEIAFVTLEGAFFEKDIFRRELVKVAYRFDEGTAELIRVRAGKSLGFDIEKAEKEVLLKGVEDFKLQYCYDKGSEEEPYLWKEVWEDKEMRIPRGVKATLLIKTEKIKEPLEFTKTIFVPIGILGEKELGL